MEEHFLLKLKESFPAADWDQHQTIYWFYWFYWTRPTRFYCRSDQLASFCFWVQKFEKVLFVWFWFFGLLPQKIEDVFWFWFCRFLA